LASLKVRGLDLRKAEMEFYMSRFSMTAGLSSIMTCLSYVGIIKIKIPEDMMPPKATWQVSMFYVCGTLTMALSMYNLVVTSFCVVYAQGLALRGPPGSVARCVRIFQTEWPSIRTVLVSSIMCLILSAMSISWMKLDKRRFYYPIPAIAVSALVVVVVVFLLRRILILQELFRIDAQSLVAGDLTVHDAHTERLDLIAEETDRLEVDTWKQQGVV